MGVLMQYDASIENTFYILSFVTYQFTLSAFLYATPSCLNVASTKTSVIFSPVLPAEFLSLKSTTFASVAGLFDSLRTRTFLFGLRLVLVSSAMEYIY